MNCGTLHLTEVGSGGSLALTMLLVLAAVIAALCLSNLYAERRAWTATLREWREAEDKWYADTIAYRLAYVSAGLMLFPSDGWSRPEGYYAATGAGLELLGWALILAPAILILAGLGWGLLEAARSYFVDPLPEPEEPETVSLVKVVAALRHITLPTAVTRIHEGSILVNGCVVRDPYFPVREGDLITRAYPHSTVNYIWSKHG